MGNRNETKQGRGDRLILEGGEMMTVILMRGGKIKMRMPGVTERADGTLWTHGVPIADGAELQRHGIAQADYVRRVKAGELTAQDRACLVKLGANPSGLEALTAEQYERQEQERIAAMRAEYDRTHPGAAERRRIDGIYAEADRKRDWPGEYHPLMIEADKALEKWRATYPREAAAERASDLRAEAEHQRSLAVGALVYDADGWIDRKGQKERAAKFEAEAAKLEAEAAKCLKAAARA